jgi:hypothetical protein
MTRLPFIAALLGLVLFAAPAAAASGMERFWVGFRGFWSGVFGSVGGVVGVALVTGVVAIIIITRGKWLK